MPAAGGREERGAGWFRLWMLRELCNIVAVEVERLLVFFLFWLFLAWRALRARAISVTSAQEQLILWRCFVRFQN